MPTNFPAKRNWYEPLSRLGIVSAITLIVIIPIVTKRRGESQSKPPGTSAIEVVQGQPLSRSTIFNTVLSNSLGHGPVASCMWKGNAHLVCNYRQLQWVNLATGDVRVLTPPEGVANWSPTCVWTDSTQDLVLVSNMSGHDVFEFRYDDTANTLRIVRRYSTAAMREPKGVALSADGRFVAVGDYEANRLWVFHRDGSLAWERPVPLAHGVDYTPDGLVVTSIGERSIHLYDATGKRIARNGRLGWGKDGYLWPTSVCWDRDRLLVSDAHTGNVKILDRSLNEVQSHGGNGPGSGLLNMPYGIAARDNTIVICDSYKDRLLVLDRDLRVQRIIASRLDRLEWHKSLTPIQQFKGYVNVTQPVRFAVPGLPVTLGYPAYSGFRRTDEADSPMIHMPTIGSLFNRRGYPYFVWATSLSHQNKEFTVFGHSQVTTNNNLRLIWVVDIDGRCIPVEVDQQLWLVEGRCYTNEGKPFSLLPSVAQAVDRLAAFDRQRTDGDDNILDLLHRTFWPTLSLANFQALLNSNFISEPGKQFWERWLAAKTDRKKQDAAKAFDDALESDPQASLWLQEIFLRNMLVPRS